jgi:hypothetical protein
MPAAGTIEEMLEKSDLVTDCTPGGIGEKNKPIYEKIGIKAIWQGARVTLSQISPLMQQVITNKLWTAICQGLSPATPQDFAESFQL